MSTSRHCQNEERPEELLRHCTEPVQRVLDAEANITEEVVYEPVPPTRVYAMRVKYRSIGQGQPLVYPLEE
jgi:hypothetical protein